MATIRPYPTFDAQLRGIPTPGGAPGGARMGADGLPQLQQAVSTQTVDGRPRDLQVAGAALERGSDSLERIALEQMRDQNETRVQDLANQYISSQQNLLYTGDGAFYRKKGRDALNAAQATTDALIERKKEFIGLAANEYQRKRLTAMLDSQVNQANEGISRFVTQQSLEYDKQVAQGRLTLLNNDAVLKAGDTDHIDGLALAAETTARDIARRQGLAGTEAETAMIVDARSNVLRNAIESRLRNGDNRSALTLWDRSRGRLSGKDNEALATAMKSTAADVAADDWINARIPNPQRDEARRFFEAKGYSSEAASALAGNFQAESQFNVNAINKGDGRDGSDSIGIGQWNADRAKNLLKFASDNKLDPRSMRTQLEFAAWELENTEKGPASRLKSAKTIEEANQAAASFFRPKEVGSERLANAKAAFEQRGVGFDKANSDVVVKAALDDQNLNPATRAAVVTKLQKQAAVTESARNASIKGLDDTLEATTQLMIAAPGAYSKGTLGKLADGYEAAGEKSKALNTRILAGMEDQLLAFATSPDEAQKRIIEGLLPGKAKALASGILSGDSKERAEAAKAARDGFAAIKTATESNVSLVNQKAKIDDVINTAVRSGDRNLVGEVMDWVNGRAAAEQAGQQPQAALTQMIGDLRDRVRTGDQANSTIIQLDQLEKIQQQQRAAFQKDPYAAGTSIYNDIGAPVAINWGDQPDNIAAAIGVRAAQARQISQRSGFQAIPFSEPEIGAIRSRLEQAPPDEQAKIMRTLSTAPPDMLPGIAAALAGKRGDGDAVSRSYAAALAFYADKDPAAQAAADQVLRGSQIIRADGAGGRKPAVTSDAWQSAYQDAVGSALQDVSPQTRQMVSDAVAAAYVYQMNRAGKQGEKPDTDVINAAIKTVMGAPISRNGQAFYPPQRGMSSYDVDNIMGRLTDGDVDGLRTMENDPVTADLIRRRGVLTNVADGVYRVRVPDPRRGGDLGDVVDPKTGRAWQLDMRPLLQRTPATPSRDPNAPDFIQAPPLARPQ